LFLTAYQIAVLVNSHDTELKGDLPIGGKGGGPGSSFAQRIAWHLSDDYKNNGAWDNRLDMKFFSIDGLDSFTFDNGHVPSANEFSMFSLI